MKKIENRKEIIDILNRGQFIPYNVIGILENTSNQGFFDDETGTVWIENDYFNYIYGDSRVLLNRISQLEDGFYGFSGVLGSLAESIYSEHLLHWFEPTERYVFKGDLETLEIQDELKQYKAVSIPLEEAKGIDDRYEYQQEGSFERIQDAIQKRPTSAIYIDNEIASYVLVHEDNSIGYMYTLEKYRQEGLGYIVTLDILRKMMAKNIVPFVEINRRNFKSQRLAQKTGFVKDAFMPWFGIIKGIPEFFRTVDPFETAPFYFTTTAQMKYADRVTSRLSSVSFDKDGDGFIAYLDESKKTSFRIRLHESKEAYIVDVKEDESVDYFELLKAIGLNLPDENASLVFRYKKGIENHFKGIKVE